MPLQVTWAIPNAPPVMRAYNGFRHLAAEEAESRIWGGIHFELESEASKSVRTQLAPAV